MNEAIIDKLRESIVNCDAERAVEIAKEVIEKGVDPIKAIEEGLSKGLRIIGERFAAGEAFLTELALGAETMKRALDVLMPIISKRGKERKILGKVVLGTVEGDIHDIGKNIVGAMLTSAGFEVIDLGVDVSTEKFVEKIKEYSPEILGMSALMTSTMVKMADVIEALKREALREKVKVMIGGAPTSKEWAEKIGADGYAVDAVDAVNVAMKLIGREKYE
ncbi:MAG: corrinoid protein [Candidatus Aenigmatarchaeota archaeon]